MCQGRVTEEELIREVGEDAAIAFFDWMRGQTYVNCRVHGDEYQRSDVDRFKAGKPS